MKINIESRCVLVTGSSGDIALPFISSLLKENIKVIGLDKAPSKIDNPLYVHKTVDLSKLEQLEHMLNDIPDLDSIDSVIHLSGIYLNKSLEWYRPATIEAVFAINVISIMEILQRILSDTSSALKNVILVSSTGATTGSRDPAYAASKSAINGLGKSLSRSLSSRGIRVNIVSPGIIDTQMSRHVQSDFQIQEHVKETLSKRIGYATDISNFLLFLLTKESEYLSAQNIHINGGLTI